MATSLENAMIVIRRPRLLTVAVAIETVLDAARNDETSGRKRWPKDSSQRALFTPYLPCHTSLMRLSKPTGVNFLTF